MSVESQSVAVVRALSARKLRANRLNAQSSTGPRSAAGKARSAQNATSHGVFCKHLVLPGEDPELFREFRNALLQNLLPQDWLECSLADQYVEARWKLRRVQEGEKFIHEVLAEVFEDRAAEQLDGIEASIDDDSSESIHFSIDADDPRPFESPERRSARRERLQRVRSGAIPACVTMIESFSDPEDAGVWDRLSRYAQRLENSALRAMRELRRHREEKRQHGFPVESPFIDPSPAETVLRKFDEIDEIVSEATGTKEAYVQSMERGSVEAAAALVGASPQGSADAAKPNMENEPTAEIDDADCVAAKGYVMPRQSSLAECPHPSPLPAYRESEQEAACHEPSITACTAEFSSAPHPSAPTDARRCRRRSC